MKKSLPLLFALFISFLFTTSSKAQLNSSNLLSAYIGYDDLNESISIGFTALPIVNGGIEFGSNFDNTNILKVPVYFPIRIGETEYHELFVSVGGALGLKIVEESDTFESETGYMTEFGLNLHLGWIYLGYSYGYDDLLEFEYNQFRIGVTQNIW
jgi:hypothetical protein